MFLIRIDLGNNLHNRKEELLLENSIDFSIFIIHYVLTP